jgi:hypothetical protein
MYRVPVPSNCSFKSYELKEREKHGSIHFNCKICKPLDVHELGFALQLEPACAYRKLQAQFA